MLIQRRLLVYAASLALLTISQTARAEGFRYDPAPNPIRDPGNRACVEPGWPYYYYRLPVIFQLVSQAGTLEFVAFGYADGCKQSGEGERGATAASLLEWDEVWVADVLQVMHQLNAALKDVRQVLPGIHHPGDNAFGWPLPDIPLQFSRLYNEAARSACRYRDRDVELICPGIPPQFGRYLQDAGFESVRQVMVSNGTERRYTRWLIDSSLWTGKARAAYGWFLSGLSTQPPNPPENFYARHWADSMRFNHSDGGVYRVILHPVDLLLSVPAHTPVDRAGNGTVRVRISNRSSREHLKTEVSWRLAGEGNWRPGVREIALAPWSTHEVDVPVSGPAGQVVELMVNPARSIPELVDPWGDAYANNVGRTTLETAGVDLQVESLTAPATVDWTPGGSYRVTWAVRNRSAATVENVPLVVTLETGGSGAEVLHTGMLTLGPQEVWAGERWVNLRSCSAAYTVTVAVNPEPHRVVEADPPGYANNQQRVVSAIGPGCEEPPPPVTDPGPGRVIIVDPHCQVARTHSHQPCANYRLTDPAASPGEGFRADDVTEDVSDP